MTGQCDWEIDWKAVGAHWSINDHDAPPSLRADLAGGRDSSIGPRTQRLLSSVQHLVSSERLRSLYCEQY